MIIWTVKHTKNVWSICEAFMEQKSAQDYADALNVNRSVHVPDSRIKYYVEELKVIEG